MSADKYNEEINFLRELIKCTVEDSKRMPLSDFGKPRRLTPEGEKQMKEIFERAKEKNIAPEELIELIYLLEHKIKMLRKSCKVNDHEP